MPIDRISLHSFQPVSAEISTSLNKKKTTNQIEKKKQRLLKKNGALSTKRKGELPRKM